jgi:tRNA modification GTPase
VSAKTGEGISRIHEFLRGYTAGLLPANNAIFLTNRRQIENLSSIGRELDDAVSLISRGSLQDELLAFHLKESLACIYDLFGEDLNSDILDNIFSRFCIGK